MLEIWNMCNSGENIEGCVSKESVCCEVLQKCPPPLPPARRRLTAYFYYNMLDRIGLRIRGLDEVQTPLLTRPVEQVARPAAVVCLCCRGWMGVLAQGCVFQGTSASSRVRRMRVGSVLRKFAPTLCFSSSPWSSFCRSHRVQWKKHFGTPPFFLARDVAGVSR